MCPMASSIDTVITPTDQRILQDCHELHNNWQHGNCGGEHRPVSAHLHPADHIARPGLPILTPTPCALSAATGGNTTATDRKAAEGINMTWGCGQRGKAHELGTEMMGGSEDKMAIARTGLLQIGRSLDLLLLFPCKKINVMIRGNHSTGKSTFINWYVEEHIQKTGKAIETEFTFATKGQRKEYLTGSATLHLYPHFRPVLEFQGVSKYLTTKISSSKQKKFSLVLFIDTLRLMDRDMKYPLMEIKCLSGWENKLTSFVLFSPMGQALCEQTLNIGERLIMTVGKKMHFYLSKADEAGRPTDRQIVLMQIVQELCWRPGLKKCGFELQATSPPQTYVCPYLPDRRADIKCGMRLQCKRELNINLPFLMDYCHRIFDIYFNKWNRQMLRSKTFFNQSLQVTYCMGLRNYIEDKALNCQFMAKQLFPFRIPTHQNECIDTNEPAVNTLKFRTQEKISAPKLWQEIDKNPMDMVANSHQ
ncbi:uncharacterized protein [Heterodontus francisci]|uniref:uncharacterized protein n=1 Tax=Heterodontus francisci TaxID=7792 RepID=UPI00355BAF3C